MYPSVLQQVFQPSFIFATEPTITGLLLGNASDAYLNVQTVYSSNTSGLYNVTISVGHPSCTPEVTRWIVSKEQFGKSALRFQLRLEKNLSLCGDNETDTNCCAEPLCVLETLQVSACVNGTPQASLLIQVQIYALLIPDITESDNTPVIPNQVFQPLGSCPCDLSLRECDVRCCCDKDCSTSQLELFKDQCFRGPFGGQVSPLAEYECAAQAFENSPDWFPFLCVTSPPENNPYLGLFYHGKKIIPKPGPSFQVPVFTAPVPVETYSQGSPVFKWNDEYFTIPQMVSGRCVENAPVAFLNNFQIQCVTALLSCPTGSPLQTRPTDLRIKVKNGQGSEITVAVTDKEAVNLSPFISSPDAVVSLDEKQACENITLALEYKLYWRGNGITHITLTRTVGTVMLNEGVVLTTRYSAVFLNEEITASVSNSGNPVYQVGRPVIGGIVDTEENHTNSIQRTSVNIWKPVGDGLCSSAEKQPIIFGVNSTSGCLLPVSQQNLTQCDLLRETVASLQETLIEAIYVAKNGNPDSLTMADWVNISFVTMNESTAMTEPSSSCQGVPSHMHILVWSLEKDIQALQVSYSKSTWALECGGGDVIPCMNLTETQLFSVTSSVTFIYIPVNTGPPKARFQINYTEYDCQRNDVCWPELAFPVTKYYTGEPYSQSLAKGLILVFFFIAASVLGTPWRQIRQAWKSAPL